MKWWEIGKTTMMERIKNNMNITQKMRDTAQIRPEDDATLYCFPTPVFRDFLEAIDALEQGMIALQTETEGVEEELLALNNRVRSLEVDCIKVMAERDALAEIHKQVIREVLNGKSIPDVKDQQEKAPSTPV